MSLKDLIAKNRKNLQRGTNNRAEKLASGKNIVRILPSWTGTEDGEFSQNWGQHFIKDTAGALKAVYICTQTNFDEICPICEAISAGMASTSDEEINKALKDSRSSKRVLVNALYLQGGKNENAKNVPVVLELPPTVFDNILATAEAFLDDGINVFDAKEGHNFVIEKTGTGMNTEYTVTPSPRASAIETGVVEKIANLTDWARQEAEAEKQKAITSVRVISGTADVSVQSGRALPAPTPRQSSRLADVDVVDADFTDVAETPLSGDNVDDFLDSL